MSNGGHLYILLYDVVTSFYLLFKLNAKIVLFHCNQYKNSYLCTIIIKIVARQ